MVSFMSRKLSGRLAVVQGADPDQPPLAGDERVTRHTL